MTNPIVSDEPLYDLSRTMRTPLQRRLFSLIRKPVERVLAFEALNRVYDNFRKRPEKGNFFCDALDQLQVRYQLDPEDLEKIPREGPLVVVANHPFGGVDGLILGAMLTSVRDDVKILANYLLSRIREIRPWLIKVDPFGRSSSAGRNIAPMKEAIRWLKQGGAVVTFPSGTVSHLQLRKKGIFDPEWSEHTVGLIRRAQAMSLPVYFEGRNSLLFQVAGLLHPILRTALLPRELVRKEGSVIRLRVGTPVPFHKLSRLCTDRDIIDELRMKTYILMNRSGEKREELDGLLPEFVGRKSKQTALIPPVDPLALSREIDRLPDSQQLLEHNEYSIHTAEAHQVPRLLKEIGRLREKTFREVGEGTGADCDLDRFDRHYLHLFMWNRDACEIVGAYRMGLTDRILGRYGRRGIYTHTLFRFKRGFFDMIDPAVELGRSFICSKYQKKYQSLSLIWRGIGEFLVRNPDYKILFGPVSISQDYHALSKDLMIQYLRKKRLNDRFSSFVQARNPPVGSRLAGLDEKVLESSLQDIDDVSALVSEIEMDGKGIPILLRQYLKLNGTLLSFNVDERFSQVVDGLILVDLGCTEKKLLKRFMGDVGHRSYLRYHGLETRMPAAG
jgi:putative hemolysin